MRIQLRLIVRCQMRALRSAPNIEKPLKAIVSSLGADCCYSFSRIVVFVRCSIFRFNFISLESQGIRRICSS